MVTIGCQGGSAPSNAPCRYALDMARKMGSPESRRPPVGAAIRTAYGRWARIPLVGRWAIAGAVTPSALWLAVVVIGVFAEGLEWAVDAIGMLFLTIVVTGIPGALVGCAIGGVDLVLGRHIQRQGKSLRSFAASSLAMALLLAGTAFFLLTNAEPTALVRIASSAAIAAIPVLICVRRYWRIVRS